MIDRLKLVSVRVSKTARALPFFRDALGFRVLTDQPCGEGGRWIELEIGNGATRLALIGTGRKVRPAPSPCISFTARDLNETCRSLAGRGVEFILPLTQHHWGQVALFRDPDGNPFALSSRR